MADIKLPALPEASIKMHGKNGKQISPEVMHLYTPEELRAIQREAMRAALQAAAKVCRDFHATDSLSNYGLVMARMIEALEIEQ